MLWVKIASPLTLTETILVLRLVFGQSIPFRLQRRVKLSRANITELPVLQVMGVLNVLPPGGVVVIALRRNELVGSFPFFRRELFTRKSLFIRNALACRTPGGVIPVSWCREVVLLERRSKMNSSTNDTNAPVPNGATNQQPMSGGVKAYNPHGQLFPPKKPRPS